MAKKIAADNKKNTNAVGGTRAPTKQAAKIGSQSSVFKPKLGAKVSNLDIVNRLDV